jgi:hypothetical protein
VFLSRADESGMVCRAADVKTRYHLLHHVL